MAFFRRWLKTVFVRCGLARIPAFAGTGLYEFNKGKNGQKTFYGNTKYNRIQPILIQRGLSNLDLFVHKLKKKLIGQIKEFKKVICLMLIVLFRKNNHTFL